MPAGMDQVEDRGITYPRVTSPTSFPSGPRSQKPQEISVGAEVQPSLLEPIHISDVNIVRATPEITNALDQRLNIDTSDDYSEDDFTSEQTSLDDIDEGKEIVYGLPIASLPTGLCYDERMRFHAEVEALTGESVHPEDPRRIYYIYKYLCDAGLVAEDNGKKLHTLANPPLFRIDARQATRDECLLVHTPQHYAFVKSTADMENDRLVDLSDEGRMDSIYFNKLSYFSSKLSAGGAIDTCRAVVDGKVKNAIAVIRPPGHHAEIDKTMGFCLFNNVCIASKVCQKDFGEKCRKILIVDWDVHHGNGCQKAFYEDPNILYISIHVHMDGHFYPSGDEGDMYHTGEGPGEGMNVNIPWPSKGMGDGDYMYAFQQIVMPIAHEFDPDFVIVAAGFDAAAGDELGGCFVSPACYAHMTHMLKSLAKGKIAVCLEGGYNFHSIAISALAVTKVLMGEPPDRLVSTAATDSARNTVKQVKEIQSKYWRSLYPKEPESGIFGGERLHDIIRQWQAIHLYDDHRFTQLHIFRDQISPSFEKQVLVTQGWEDKKNLLVIFHDPPDLLGSSRMVVNDHEQHDLQNTWLVDGLKSYIARAVRHDFGVIDVNIPSHITDPEPTSTASFNASRALHETPLDVQKKQSERLAIYLWENYISVCEHENVFLMGVGNAFHGIARLLSEKEEVHQMVTGVIVFIAANPVKPVTNSNIAGLSEWYRANSLVFVSPTHSVWLKDKKVSKKFGRMQRSRETVLNRMVKSHEEAAWKFIESRLGESSDDAGDEDVERKPLPQEGQAFGANGPRGRGSGGGEEDVVMTWSGDL